MVYSSSDMSNHYYPEPPCYRKLPACGCKKISPYLRTRAACAKNPKHSPSSTFFAPSLRSLREKKLTITIDFTQRAQRCFTQRAQRIFSSFTFNTLFTLFSSLRSLRVLCGLCVKKN
jgi:hypothetical protein